MLTVFAVLQALLISGLLGLHFLVGLNPGTPNGNSGTGDFPAFFTGAVLIDEGRGSELYDFSAQQTVQSPLLDQDRYFWQPYLNPPGLALALAPMTRLGFIPSFLLFSAIQALFLSLSIIWLAGVLPRVADSPRSKITMVLLVISNLPVALTTFGGQNTGFSLGLLACIFAGIQTGRAGLAGVALGLLTFKPQYAVLVGVVLLARGHYRLVATAAMVGLVHFGLAAYACGLAWPLELWGALSTHGPLEMLENGGMHFSLPAVAHFGLRDPFPTLVVWVGAFAILGLLYREGRLIPTTSAAYPAFFGLVICAALLLSPHLQFYEAGILTLPALLAMEAELARTPELSIGLRFLLVIGYFSFPLWQLSESFGFQPLFLPLLGLFLWTLRLAHIARSPSR